MTAPADLKPLRDLFDALKFQVVPEAELERRERDARIAEARGIRDRLPAFLRARVPELVERISDSRLDAVARWTPAIGTVVVLGQSGTGKSTAAAVAYLRQVSRGVSQGGAAWSFATRLAWFHASELQRARLEHPLGRGEAPEIRRAIDASLCVIDDLAWDRDPEPCSTVIAARYERAAPTIVTSGRTRAELHADYSEAVLRRLTDAGGLDGLVVEL